MSDFFKGYKLTKHDDENFTIKGFTVEGPRGAQYSLIQNFHKPDLYSVVNFNSMTNHKIKGYSWFKMVDGKLIPHH